MANHSYKDKGFSVFEAIALAGVIVLIILIGLFVYNKHSGSGGYGKSNVYKSSYSNSSWSTYKSQHSSLEFQYPSNWKFQSNPQLNSNYTLENATITGPNHIGVEYTLDKTYHGPIIHNAACMRPPVVTVLANLNDGLKISYSSYDSYIDGIWLQSQDHLLPGYGQARGQCQVEGVNYVALPNDKYATLNIFMDSSSNMPSAMKASNYLSQPDTKTAEDILKSFKY